MSAIDEHYARCLGTILKGHSFARPGPSSKYPNYFKTGAQLFDLCFINSDGRLEYIYSTSRPRNSPRNLDRLGRCLAPKDHEAANIYCGAEDFNSDPIKSMSFWHAGTMSCVNVSGDASISIPSGDGSGQIRGSLAYSVGTKDSALLYLPGQKNLSIQNTEDQLARNYARSHTAKWFKFVNDHLVVGVNSGDLYFLTHVQKAQEWHTVTAFQKQSALALNILLHPIQTLGVGLSAKSLRFAGTKHEISGPIGNNLPISQCTMVRGWRLRMSKWKFRQEKLKGKLRRLGSGIELSETELQLQMDKLILDPAWIKDAICGEGDGYQPFKSGASSRTLDDDTPLPDEDEDGWNPYESYATNCDAFDNDNDTSDDRRDPRGRRGLLGGGLRPGFGGRGGPPSDRRGPQGGGSGHNGAHEGLARGRQGGQSSLGSSVPTNAARDDLETVSYLREQAVPALEALDRPDARYVSTLEPAQTEEEPLERGYHSLNEVLDAIEEAAPWCTYGMAHDNDYLAVLEEGQYIPDGRDLVNMMTARYVVDVGHDGVALICERTNFREEELAFVLNSDRQVTETNMGFDVVRNASIPQNSTLLPPGRGQGVSFPGPSSRPDQMRQPRALGGPTRESTPRYAASRVSARLRHSPMTIADLHRQDNAQSADKEQIVFAYTLNGR